MTIQYRSVPHVLDLSPWRLLWTHLLLTPMALMAELLEMGGIISEATLVALLGLHSSVHLPSTCSD